MYSYTHTCTSCSINSTRSTATTWTQSVLVNANGFAHGLTHSQFCERLCAREVPLCYITNSACSQSCILRTALRTCSQIYFLCYENQSEWSQIAVSACANVYVTSPWFSLARITRLKILNDRLNIISI